MIRNSFLLAIRIIMGRRNTWEVEKVQTTQLSSYTGGRSGIGAVFLFSRLYARIEPL